MTEKLLGKYKLVLGLEIHFHLKTSQKMFCGCNAKIWRAAPNTHTCPTCLGLPGALPVPNFEAVQHVHLLGIALNCKLNTHSKFDRKNYFYPDLPKGYQISQYKEPLCGKGFMTLDSGAQMSIERIHLEEDTAKSFHLGNQTLIDFNKSGMPLAELVTAPVFTSIDDALEFSKKLRDLVRYLGISDADMEKGQFRIEPNISLRTVQMEQNAKLPNYKVEIKNINSFRFMTKAVLAEITRQRALLDKGDQIKQENRGYDETTKTTVPQREKEEAHDYRYFPEPDVPPMEFDTAYFEKLRNNLPELPNAIKARLINNYGVSEKNACALISGETIALVPRVEELAKEGADANKVVNLLLNRPDYRDLSIKEFLERIQASETPFLDSATLQKIVAAVIESNPNAVDDYKKGTENAVMFLLGKVMRETKGKASPTMAKTLLYQQLSS